MSVPVPAQPGRPDRRESLRHPELVVKARRPALARVALILLGSLACLALAAVAFEGGRRFGQEEWRNGTAALSQLQREAKVLAADNDILRRQVAALRTARVVDEEAHNEVRRMLVDLEDEVQQQQEELDFYRTIVSPEDGMAGLRIQDFRIVRAAEKRRYRMELVLVQAAKHDKAVSGVVSFALEGASAGQPVRLAAGELVAETEDGSAPLDFSFRYFKDLEQDIRLPEGFVPDRVVVEVSPEGEPERVIRQSFDWAVKS
jgi:hypothetical protein